MSLLCNVLLFPFQTGEGDIPENDPIHSNSGDGGNEIMGDDDSSRSSVSEDCAMLPSSGDNNEGLVVGGEPDTSSNDSCDASVTSAESTNPDEVYDTSMEEVLHEQGRQSM